MFAPRVERWRSIVSEVSDLPADLILAIIELESGGVAGRCSSANACGLMQVKPSVVETYNRSHRPISFDRMRGHNTDDARAQIAIGSWFLEVQLKNAHRMDPARAPWPEGPITPWQIHAADLAYARGPGAFQELRRRANAAGYPDDIDGWQTYRDRKWSTWTSENTFFHARAAALLSREGGTRKTARKALPEGFTKPPRPPRVAEEKGAGLIAALAIGAALLFSRRS